MDYEILLQIPGRLRIKIKSLYKNYKLAEAISSIPQDDFDFIINPNIYTSNVLIVFDNNKVNAQNIIKLIKNAFNQSYNYYSNDYINMINKNNCNIGNNIAENNSHNEININKKSIILKNNLFKKYASKIDKIFSIKKTLIGLSFLSLLWYRSYLAILIIAVYLINKCVDLILYHMYKNNIKYCTKFDLSKNFNSWKKYKNYDTQMTFFLKRIELVSISIALLTLYFGANPIILFTIIMLSQLNEPFLASLITYVAAYFNMLKEHILLNNMKKILKFDTIETIIFLVNNNNIYVNKKIIEDFRERGILEIKIISNSHHSYLNQLQADLGISVSYYNSLENGLYNEINLLKKQNKNIALVSNVDLFIPKKFTDEINLNILISDNIGKQYKNFDIVLLENNIHLIGNTIDYIKYIKEKVLQNQIMFFWIYILCMVLAFNKSSPLLIWLIATLKKIFVYKNSLKSLKYNLSMG